VPDRRWLDALLLLGLAALATVTALALSGLSRAPPPRPQTGSVTFTRVGFPVGGIVAPGPRVGASAGVRELQIEAIGVRAPVVSLGVSADGQMETLVQPDSAGWYAFSAVPGSGGNAVFAGHVDFAGRGPAVFARLRELRPEAVVRLLWEDGSTLVYRVVDAQTYVAETAPVASIIGPTDVETLTLIAPAGQLDPATRQWDERLVVRAVLVP
jgi:sortase (surface protein transpeptidase)